MKKLLMFIIVFMGLLQNKKSNASTDYRCIDQSGNRLQTQTNRDYYAKCNKNEACSLCLTPKVKCFYDGEFWGGEYTCS